jgi:exopolyphosphatase/guanosine-5'-triphosphate,3'-diphosphate pyrophosphatase
MVVGVIDVGSNTTRMLVAKTDGKTVRPVVKERVRLALGAEIERAGGVSDVSIAAAARAVGKLSAVARRRGVEQLDVFLTAPGRQSENASDLVAAISHAAGQQVRVLTAVEEGRLAYAGAIVTAPLPLPDTVAVCDVGGASTEIAVGAPLAGPSWVGSIALGSVRLNARADGLGHACMEAARAVASLDPPPAQVALAVGGSARAARRLVGPVLGREQLALALEIVDRTSERRITRRFDVHPTRAQILPAGIAMLSAVYERLGMPLHVCDGGIREGAVLEGAAALAA